MSNKKKSTNPLQRRALHTKRKPWWQRRGWVLMTLVAAVTIGILVTRSGPDSETGVAEESAATHWNPAWPELPRIGGISRPMQLIRAAYAFAANRPDVVQYLPCYCGCEKQGHRSLEFCFVKSRKSSGITEWDNMGFT